MTRRADRLLQIIQILRRHKRPVTAQEIAAEMEVTVRTIYRDMVALEVSGVPVRGEAGIGYVLEVGYDLPPLMFTIGELEALLLGARMVQAEGDADFGLAAMDAVAKIEAVLPADMKELIDDFALGVPPRRQSGDIDLSKLRSALRHRNKVHIVYGDKEGRASERVIWPILIAYFEGVRIIAAWCELRQDFRHFRADRISELTILDEKYRERRKVLYAQWWASGVARRG